MISMDRSIINPNIWTDRLLIRQIYTNRLSMLRREELEPVQLYPGGLYNYRKIKAATKNFDVANRIGEGGFGTVYKGTLSNGTAIAVKKLSATKEGMWEFAEKSRAIAGMKHPNLVTLMGCCAGNNQLLLIYEFIGTTSLEDALFGSDNEKNGRLDWATRYRICVGLAEGLCFLHKGSKQEAIHGDIKPANIILDDDLNPKLYDFGFAKLYHKQKSERTMLYTAPEVKVHPLEASADVYSFGVVMLILVSGRKIKTPRAGGETIYLVDEAQIMDRSGTLMELVDHKLSYDWEEAEMILRLAMQCIDSPPFRPTMSTIVKILKKECSIETILINAARPEGECSIQTLLINAPTPEGILKMDDDYNIYRQLMIRTLKEPVELYPGGLYNYRKIKAATNNFHVANRIGEGGFGTVYKGTLSNGTAIAVKKLSATKEGMWEFAEKSRAIAGMKHPNLVTLMGCCAGNNQLLLIYEFIGTTSLEDALFGSDDELRKRLDWQTRCEICLGLAEGLAFLHEGSKQEIIHGDIKPAYILLDDDLNPKISDFGFARHYHKQNSEGTMSYTAPEVKDRPLEASADVYSFGVVMLILFSGRKIKTPRAGGETVYLVDEAQIMDRSGTLMELVDHNLSYDWEEAEMILRLAMQCIDLSLFRPTMSAIVKKLKKEHSIQTIFINAERVELYPGGLYYYREIKASTKNFDIANRLGEGGFGTIYKGTLLNGLVVAVKKLLAAKEGMHEFAEKRRAIAGIKHPNLVTLMGCCAGKNQLLLIYEFIGTTSLEDALFGSDKLRKRLDWQTRCKICLGLAEGLSFLHEVSKQEIIHGDINPENIFLDNDLNPRIYDFGFAKLYHKQKSEGTMSYTAPEVKYRPLEASADVYSFGVVMLVLFSGRKIKTLRVGAQTGYLVDEAQIKNENGTLMELVDQNLNYNWDDAEVILTLAMKCLKSPPSSRDTMATIVEKLKKLRCNLNKPEGD
ncbi:putative LRR receptor-like serine/threonine-protein kinase [Capsicum galapagoense]